MACGAWAGWPPGPWGPRRGLAIAVAPYLAVIAVAIGVTIVRQPRGFLLPPAVADAHPETDSVADEPVHLRHAGRLLRCCSHRDARILCIILQSTASMWGAVYLTDVLGLAAGTAGGGFVVFITAWRSDGSPTTAGSTAGVAPTSSAAGP